MMDIDYFVQQLKYFWSNMNICLTTIDWTAIGGIATFVMALATFWSLRQNKSQLKELRRQWEELNRPRIAPLPKKIDNNVCLTLKNYSSVLAYNVIVAISIESEIGYMFDGGVSKKTITDFDKNVKNIVDATYIIEPNGTKDLILGRTYTDSPAKYEGILNIEIKCNDIYREKHQLNFAELSSVTLPPESIQSVLKTIAQKLS